MFRRTLTCLLAFGLLASAVFAADLAETRKKAESGDADAQIALGLRYHKGEGVPKDLVEAVKWYRKAAEQGDFKVQYNLGNMHYYGTGVPKDYATAVKLYRKAAEQHAIVQHFLGLFAYSGNGVVPKDLVQAHAWLNIAAAKGNESAKDFLALVQQEMTSEQYTKAMKLARDILPAWFEKK